MLRNLFSSKCPLRIQHIPKRSVMAHATSSTPILFALNGKEMRADHVEPGTTILQYLRSTPISLTGTKLGCEEGGCGACTVQISHWDSEKKQAIHKGVNACLAPFHIVDGHHLITVEGIGNTKNMHPIQEQMSISHGSQCGFCTPGIVMALHSYVAGHPKATKTEIEHCLDGNLCRCTGYRPILDAAKRFGCGKDSSKNLQVEATSENSQLKVASESLICPSTKSVCDCGQGVTPNILMGGTTPDFPEFLKNYKPKSLSVKGKDVSWYRPTTITELLDLKKKFPHAKVVVGSTEVSIEVKFKNQLYPVLISPTAVPEMIGIEVKEDGIEFGAATSITNLSDFFQVEIEKRPKWQTRGLQAMIDQLRWFAGPQIKNVACLGSNIATASPISDINPLLVALGARLKILSTSKGERVIQLKGEFFRGYRKIDLSEDEVIITIHIPFTRELEFVRAYKQARRREDDIAIVSAAFRVLLEKSGNQFFVKECVFGYGGMDARMKEAPKTSQFLVGKSWDLETLDHTYKLLEKDLPLSEDAPGGMVPYRRTLSTSFWFKFFLFVRKSLGLKIPDNISNILDPIPSRPLSSALQTYALQKAKFPVGEPLAHLSASKQVTGEAIFVDDLEMPSSGSYGYFVTSTKPHAKILRVDPSAALEMDGVLGFFSAKDIPGKNEIGPIFKKEELFAVDTVLGIGYPIGLIVATTAKQAERASLAVKVEYQDLPHILTIPEAIKEKKFFPTFSPYIMERGEPPEKLFPTCDFVIEGDMATGGQEQFYLEPQVSHVVPGEDDEVTVYASTQNPTETQLIVAEVLGIPANRVVCKVKRMGGGFGGKETRSIFISCAAALAAKHLKRPVRILLDRDDDMIMTGGRHPFYGKYKVGFSKNGDVQALDIKLYSNAGWSPDLSSSVMERALFHVDNAYFIPNVRAAGFLCFTNIASNTAFRGFGGPQSMLICESWMDHIARVTGLPPNEVRRKNMYKEGQSTPFHQVLKKHDVTASRCWDELLPLTDYDQRLKAINHWNKSNHFHKRGIACIPTKFGMSFTARMMNQAGALVHIYKDGSVLISHAGTEMGQGLHTKMAQVAAKVLGIPVSQVYIAETSTDKVPNTSPTAASVQSDLNGGAIMNACEKLNRRLEPIKKENPNASFKEIAMKAFIKHVDLSAHGFFSREHIGYDWASQKGNPFSYYVAGAACSEVELDCLTGDFQILRSDIVMDVGESLSPSIDIGQIEGAFAQGLGWTTIEDVVYLKNGMLHSRGPGAYKLPGFQTVPLDMRVHLLKDAPNPTTIYSSKGIGEPPLFLGCTVFFALKEAAYAARADNNLTGWFPLNAPATCERIRMSCKDHLTRQFEDDQKNY